MLSKKVHQTIFVLGSALLVIGLPVSKFLLSVSMFLLALNWALEGRFLEKFEILKKRKSLILLASIYLVHVIWMINTKDFTNGIHDLKIKLPLLLMPVIFGTSRPYNRFEFKLILLLFVATVIVNSLITSLVLFGFTNLDPVDSRDASLFISHIRFSLMVVLSIYTLFYFLFFRKHKLRYFEKIFYAICLIWLLYFLIILQSFTGIVIFIVLLPLAIVWWSHMTRSVVFIRSSYIICSLILIGVFAYTLSSVNRYNTKLEVDLDTLENQTINGNSYDHSLEAEAYENGHRIWLYIAENELEKEWNKVSNFEFNGLDRKNQTIKYTLIRYMTSLGLRKDSLDFAKLSPEDIEMVEKGYTSIIHKKKFALYPRIYEILWELDRYRKTGDPSGQSLGQRIEYAKVGLNIVKRFFWFGTGTGDLKSEFKNQYEIDQSLLKPEWRHRAHNQYLTFLITFGIFGFLWILFALISPVIFEKKYDQFLVMTFLILSLLSMVNEDTLETHIGVTLISFFYSFFLFAAPEYEPIGNEET